MILCWVISCRHSFSCFVCVLIAAVVDQADGAVLLYLQVRSGSVGAAEFFCFPGVKICRFHIALRPGRVHSSESGILRRPLCSRGWIRSLAALKFSHGYGKITSGGIVFFLLTGSHTALVEGGKQVPRLDFVSIPVLAVRQSLYPSQLPPELQICDTCTEKA